MKRASTSAAARLNVLWPDVYAENAGVTNVSFWYGTQVLARLHARPLCCVAGSAGAPGQAFSATSPTNSASAWCRSPGALESAVMTSMRPGINGSPSGS